MPAVAKKKAKGFTLAALPEIPETIETEDQLLDAASKVVKWVSRASAQIEEIKEDLDEQTVYNLATVVDGAESADELLSRISGEIEQIRRKFELEAATVKRSLLKRLGGASAASGRGPAKASSHGAPRTRATPEAIAALRMGILSALYDGPLKRAGIEERLRQSSIEFKDATLIKAIADLKEEGYISSEGERRGMQYSILAKGKKELQ